MNYTSFVSLHPIEVSSWKTMCRQPYQPSLQITRYRRYFHLHRGPLEESEQLSFLRAYLELVPLLVMLPELLGRQRCLWGGLGHTHWTHPMAGWHLQGEGGRAEGLGICALLPAGLWHPGHKVGLNGVRCLLSSVVCNSGLFYL